MLIARQVHIRQRGPIDFLTYQIAADKVARGESPYRTIDEDLAIWATSSCEMPAYGILRSIRSTAAPQFY